MKKQELEPIPVPSAMPYYVHFGETPVVKRIVASGVFYPTYLVGPKGCGKTESVRQTCAELNRKFIRIPINRETDEFSLLGGFHLVNGETVFEYGPIVRAMQEGAVAVLDEIDTGSYNLMCLQPILEGNPVYLKRVNEIIEPKPGFQIFATANTKGDGGQSASYAWTGVINQALMDRFAPTLELDYPPGEIELQILHSFLEVNQEEILSNSTMTIDELKHSCYILALWAKKIRDEYKIDAIQEVISTRRLIMILQGIPIFGSLGTSASYAIRKFDGATASAMKTYLGLIHREVVDSNGGDAGLSQEEIRERLESVN